jgi:nitrogen-specific signal transduction histidine kinase/ActR/RegA family two-component response regulator
MKEILCIGNDITALENARQEKEALEAQLQVSQKMEAVGTLAGGIAHDFNNILQAILSNIQVLMMSKSLNVTQKDTILSAVEKSVGRASDLTKRLLLFSRKVDSDLRPIDIREELEHVIKMLERTIPKMISIDLNLDEDLEFINADPSQIEQILMNLAINSRDAMPEGGTLTFGLKNIVVDEAFCKKNLGLLPGKYVLMTVSDTGYGIDLETQKHIFEPFFTTKETGKGTGLGLATVYGIMKNHRGYISCESMLGQGCTFRLYFPALKDKYLLDEATEEDQQVKGGDETILLVDDEEGLRAPAEILLRAHGYNPISAISGEDALEIYRDKSEEIDLVLLDLIMPGMGGERCLEEIVKINNKAKVIMISGYANIESDETVEKYAKDFVVKPYESNNLLKVVRNVLDKN